MVGLPLGGRAPRPGAGGETKWNHWKLWNLSLEGVTSFTTVPLRAATHLGLATAPAAMLCAVRVVAKAALHGDPVAGYPGLTAVVLFLGGVQLTTLGVTGEYLGRVFNKAKGRPLHLVGTAPAGRSGGGRAAARMKAAAPAARPGCPARRPRLSRAAA